MILLQVGRSLQNTPARLRPSRNQENCARDALRDRREGLHPRASPAQRRRSEPARPSFNHGHSQRHAGQLQRRGQVVVPALGGIARAAARRGRRGSPRHRRREHASGRGGDLRRRRDSARDPGDPRAPVALLPRVSSREAGVRVPISVDTYHSEVARRAVEAGADLVNDISAGENDPAMLPFLAEAGVPVVLMHKRGDATTMDSMARYDDVVREVASYCRQRAEVLMAMGVPRWNIVVDPGLGFAKNTEQNCRLVREIPRFNQITGNMPLLVGSSVSGLACR